MSLGAVAITTGTSWSAGRGCDGTTGGDVGGDDRGDCVGEAEGGDAEAGEIEAGEAEDA